MLLLLSLTVHSPRVMINLFPQAGQTLLKGVEAFARIRVRMQGLALSAWDVKPEAAESIPALVHQKIQ